MLREEYLRKKQSRSSRRRLRAVVVVVLCAALITGYLLQGSVTAAASMLQASLSDGGSAVNPVNTTARGLYTNTQDNDTVYYVIYQESSGIGHLAWNLNFNGALTGVTEDKVTYVEVYMTGNLSKADDFFTAGDEDITLKAYNWDTTSYDLVLDTHTMNSNIDAEFTFTGPEADYSSYFNASGDMKIQVYDETSRSGFPVQLNIDYMKLKIYYDDTDPVVNLTGPAVGTTVYTKNASYSLTASTTDNSDPQQTGVSGVGFYYNNGSEQVMGNTYTPAAGNRLSGTWSYDWTIPGEGTYAVYARAYDGKNNITANTATGNLVVDWTAPTAAITAPGGGDRIGGTYVMTGTAKDEKAMDYYRVEYQSQGGGAWTQINSDYTTPVDNSTLLSWNTLTVPEGVYNIRLTVADEATNTSTATVTPVTIDHTDATASLAFYSDSDLTIPIAVYDSVPQIKAGTVYVKMTPSENLLNSANANEITIDAPGVANDVSGADFTFTGGNWVYTWTVAGGSDGTGTTFSVKTTDLAGNEDTAAPTSGGSVNIDTTAPAFSLQYYSDAGLTTALAVYSGKPVAKAGTVYVKMIPAAGENLSRTVGANKITITAPSGGNSVTDTDITWDADKWAFYYAWTVVAETDGNTTFTVTAADAAGNTTTNGVPTAGADVTIDTTSPTAAVTAPATSDRIRSSYNITGTAKDTGGMDYYKLEYKLNSGGSWTQIGSNQTTPVDNGTLLTWDTTTVFDGVYDLRLTVADKAGNTNSTATVNSFTVDNTAPTAGLEFYSDSNLTIPVGVYNSIPQIKAGTVYVKLVPSENLLNGANANEITIDAPGAANDVSGADFTLASGNWSYAWTVAAGNDGAGTTFSVKATDTAGNARTAAPTSGGSVNIDTTAPTFSLQYYSNSALTAALPVNGSSVPLAKAGTVYVKMIPAAGENLSRTVGANKITITAPSGGNSVTDANITWDAGNWAFYYAWTVIAQTDGNTTFTVTATDAAGNITTNGVPTSGSQAVIDTTSPTAAVTAPAAGNRIRSTYDIIGTAQDTGGLNYYRLEYKLNSGGSWTQIGTDQTNQVAPGGILFDDWNTTAVFDGVYDLRLTVADKAGNTASTVTVTAFTIDNTAATASLAYYSDVTLLTALPVNGSSVPLAKAGTVYIKMTPSETLRSNAGDNQITIDAPNAANDVTNADFTWNGSAWVYAWTVSAGAGVDGTTTSITVKRTDLAGNTATSAPTAGTSVVVDTTAPTFSLAYYSDSTLTTALPANGATKTWAKARTVYIKLNPAETLRSNAGDQQITINAQGTANDVTAQNFTWTAGVSAWVYTWTVSAGTGVDGDTNSITVKATDLAGNVTAAGTPTTGAIVTVDTTAPTTAITDPVNLGSIGTRYDIQGTAADSQALDYYKVEYSVYNRYSWTAITTQTNPVTGGSLVPGVPPGWDTAAVTEGYYNIRVWAFDKAGNYGVYVVYNVYVDHGSPYASVQYYSDAGFTQPLPTVAGVPQAKPGSVYVKLIPTENLKGTAGSNQVTIDAQGAASDVTNQNFSYNAGVWSYTWTVASGSDGTASTKVKLTDVAGNVYATSWPTSGGIINIDTVAPTVGVSYYSDAALTTPVPVYSGKPILKPGTVYVKVYNITNGPLSSTPGDHTFSTSTPNGANNVTNAPFTWNAAASSWVYAWNITSGNDGAGTVSVSMKDIAGNTGTGAPTSGAAITIDTTGPTASITDPVNGARFKGTYTVMGSAGDETNMNYYKVDYRLGAGSWTNIVDNQTTSAAGDSLVPLGWNTGGLTTGNYDLRLTVYDKAGNTNTSTVNVIVDNSPPVLGVRYYTELACTNELRTYSGNPISKTQALYIKLVSDENLSGTPKLSITGPGAYSLANADFTLDGGAWKYAWTPPAGPDGNFSITVNGTDVVGNNYNNTAVPGGTLTVDNAINTPSILSYTIANPILTLNWSQDPDYYQYKVYSSASSGFTPDAGNLVATVTAPANSGDVTLPGGTSYFKVIAYDLGGNISGASNEIKVYRQLGSATSAYLRYYNNPATVDISVYWDDSDGGSSLFWAKSMEASGARLYWQTAGLTITGAGTPNAIAALNGTEKYVNYFFQLRKGGLTNTIRAFPVDFGDATRYQNDYAHGNFTPNTNMCSYCHSTHSALKAQLLKQSTYYQLCMLCHGNSASQSKYDVEKGMVKVGGSYGVSGWVYSPAGPIKMGTSAHNVDDSQNTTTSVFGSNPSQMLTFTCVSCHNGHGGPDDNYRLIKKTIYPANNNWNPQTVSLSAYAVVNDRNTGEEVYWVSGNTEFCAACHLDYMYGSNNQANGVYLSAYRHPVTVGSLVYSVETQNFRPQAADNLPLQYYNQAAAADKRTSVVCSTCHYAHGTYRAFNVNIPPTTTNQNNQKMLRLDNYGVCQSCHQK